MHPDMCFSAQDARYFVEINGEQIEFTQGGFIPIESSVQECELDAGELIVPISDWSCSVPFEYSREVRIAFAVLFGYQNRRVMHLAKHHPKERVRKKNFHRIMRWYQNHRGGPRQ